jgi:putative transposase
MYQPNFLRPMAHAPDKNDKIPLIRMGGTNEGGPQIMRHLNGAYTTYFNVKRKRAGHLFQGRYKAILVEANRYAAELSRYIHLNPVRAGIVDSPEGYLWYSYRSYIGQNTTPSWLKTEFIFNYFGDKTAVAKSTAEQS